jgi:hypothetical protein
MGLSRLVTRLSILVGPFQKEVSAPSLATSSCDMMETPKERKLSKEQVAEPLDP